MPAVMSSPYKHTQLHATRSIDNEAVTWTRVFVPCMHQTTDTMGYVSLVKNP
jgi:hypothetical protein